MQPRRITKQKKYRVIRDEIIAVLFIGALIIIFGLFSYIAYLQFQQNTIISLAIITLAICSFLYSARFFWLRRNRMVNVDTVTFDEETDINLTKLFTNQDYAINAFEDMLSE